MHNKNNEIRLNKDTEFSDVNDFFDGIDLNVIIEKDVSLAVDLNNKRKPSGNIGDVKVSELHDRILKQNEAGDFDTQSVIASSFGYKCLYTFRAILGQVNISIFQLQTLAKNDAPEYFKDLYDKKISELPKRNLAECTFRYVHEVMCQSESVESAANILGIRGDTLNGLLNKISKKYQLKKKELAFNFLNKLSFDEAADKFLFYDLKIGELIAIRSSSPSQRIKEKLDPMLSQLHDMIQEEDARGGNLEKIIVNKLHHASIISLRMCLSGIKTSVRELQTLSKKDASEQFKGFYEKKISELPKRDFRQCTIRDIHKAILTASCREEAGNCLGVRAPTCRNNLRKISQKYQVSITYERLFKLGMEEAATIFHPLYDKKVGELLNNSKILLNVLNPHAAIQNDLEINSTELTRDEPVNFLNLALRNLHKIILDSGTYDDLCQKTNISINLLDDYLRVMGAPYLLLKKLSVVKASECFGTEYELSCHELFQKRKKTIATIDNLSYQNKRQKTEYNSSPNSQPSNSFLSEEKKLEAPQTASNPTTASLANLLTTSNSPVFSLPRWPTTNENSSKNLKKFT